jgi:selenocysteine-specific elongation factor
MRLHVDRAFTIKGAGTVVTGTLWSGSVGRGDVVALLPRGLEARVRTVQVHDRPVERAAAGQRVAVNLVGVEVREVARGDVLADPGSALRPTYVVDAALDVREEPAGRVQVHHGTREAPARVAALGGRFFQLRLEHPLVAADGDRLIVRRIAPPDTLGGGVVLDAHARKHGPSPEASARLERLARGERVEPAPARKKGSDPLSGGDSRGLTPLPLSAGALALEERLRAAGHEPPTEAELGDAAAELPALRAAGRAVRVGRTLHYHPEALAGVERRVAAFCEAHGSITIAQLRDELGTTRKFAQALLEHFDAAKFTRRRGDEHVLRRR